MSCPTGKVTYAIEWTDPQGVGRIAHRPSTAGAILFARVFSRPDQHTVVRRCVGGGHDAQPIASYQSGKRVRA